MIAATVSETGMAAAAVRVEADRIEAQRVLPEAADAAVRASAAIAGGWKAVP